MTDYLNLSKYLLLFQFVILGVKVDSNLLSFLEIQDNNLVGLNLKNTIIINSLINKNNFNLLSELELLDNLRNKLTSMTDKETHDLTINELYLINTVLEHVFEKKKFYQLEDNEILSSSSKSNALFKESRKILEGI